MLSDRAAATRIAPFALAACAAAASAAPGCYGATEIRVAVTTTADCASVVTTQLFTGAPGTRDFGTAPAAETTECGSAEPRVGTLAIVPSGARDEQFELQVVGAVGVPASECRDVALGSVGAGAGSPGSAKTKGCIVARRRVSFRPHKSLSVPVLLSARCIDVPCGVDETCDLGVCTATADCTESGCPRERNEVVVDGGDGAADGAVVDAADAAPDAPLHPTCGTTPEVVVDGQAIQGQLAMDGADFVYAQIATVLGAEIRRVPRSGGKPPTTVLAVPYLVGVAAGNGSLAWAVDASGQLAFRLRTPAGETSYQAEPYVPSYNAMALAGPYVVGIANATAGGAHAFAVSDMPRFDPALAAGPASEIVVDDQQHFYGVANNQVIVHYGITAGIPAALGKIASAGTPKGDIAIAGRTLFVALGDGATSGIHRIERAAIQDPYTAPPWIATAFLPQSMASDGTYLYYLSGTALSRALLTASGPSPVYFGDTGADADRLQVDDGCIYWVEGKGKRIMRRAKQ